MKCQLKDFFFFLTKKAHSFPFLELCITFQTRFASVLSIRMQAKGNKKNDFFFRRSISSDLAPPALTYRSLSCYVFHPAVILKQVSRHFQVPRLLAGYCLGYHPNIFSDMNPNERSILSLLLVLIFSDKHSFFLNPPHLESQNFLYVVFITSKFHHPFLGTILCWHRCYTKLHKVELAQTYKVFLRYKLLPYLEFLSSPSNDLAKSQNKKINERKNVITNF